MEHDPRLWEINGRKPHHIFLAVTRSWSTFWLGGGPERSLTRFQHNFRQAGRISLRLPLILKGCSHSGIGDCRGWVPRIYWFGFSLPVIISSLVVTGGFGI